MFQWYILTQLGPGIESDAFFASMTVPQLVLAIISGSLVHVLVPLLAGETEEKKHHDSWAFLLLIGGLFAFVAAILIVFAPLWVPLSVPGFDDIGHSLTIELTRIQLVGMFFTAVNAVQWATYHAKQKFLWSEISALFTSVLAFIVLIQTLPQYGVIAAAWLSILRIVLQTILLLPGMGRPVIPNFRTGSVHIAWERIKPLLAGNAYYKTEPLLDRLLLSMAVSGSLSLYYFAQQGYGAITHVLNRAIANPLVPKLSLLFKNDDFHEAERLYYKKIVQVSLIWLIGILVLVLFGDELLEFFVGYGGVEQESVEQLWWILVWLAGMLIGAAAGQIASTAFYSMGNTVTPTRMSIITYTTYMPVKLIVFFEWGVFGLALATSVYYMSNLLIQMFLLNRRWRLERTF